MLASTPSPIKLSRGSSLSQRIVYKLTKNTVMKFRPEPTEDQTASPTLMDRIKSLSRTRIFSKRQDSESKGDRSLSNSLVTKTHGLVQPLKFLFKLDQDSYLIGNKLQLDAFSITMIEDYLQTEQLWTFKLKEPILHAHADHHRKTLVVIVKGQMQIYAYEGKKSKNSPVFQKSIKLADEVKMLQMAKDSLLAVFNEQYVSFFLIDGVSSRQTIRKELGVDKQFQLFQLAPCIDNVLNVFFSRQKEEEMLEVWGLQIQIQGFGVQVHELKKVYDIENKYRSTIKIESISSDCYLINIGQAILMFRKGYLVDRASINIHVEGSFLKYFDKQLIHVVPSQIDFYHTQVFLNSNPPKLTIISDDSVQALPESSRYTFLNALKFDQHRIGFFYQLPLNGEVKYYLTLTQQWDFEEKVNSILPKVAEYKPQDYKELIKKIEECCATVNKMGVSRKEAYLRIWNQSNKQSVEEFKLLLDTMDYDTIRNEILLKLKKKSMTFIEVYKIEQGCLGMLTDSFFSSKAFSADQFKNYLLSHFLIRKLQLFKELKMYERKSGKAKVDESDKSKDKLMITIQEYTNFAKMDIKGYLLELIYNYCKFRKQLSTQIRMVIRKFKFAFRYIYSQLLSDIAAAAKEDLYFLLQSIPELLPYTQNFGLDTEDASLYEGVWGQVKLEDWEQSLYLTNVVTVYNREMVIEASKAVWMKRNWLTSHDMIFLSRPQLESEYAKVRGQNLFYNLIQHIFTHFSHQEQIDEMLNFVQQKYSQFPKHLLNNIMLYRNLFTYFVKNQVMDEPFQVFLRHTDQQIFKKIFDHEKFKKGSFLKEVKPIFQNLKLSNKFNYGLLKYFSSPLSQVSDIKYLLNRINNEKREFHAENEEMYEVLMKGMQIKLKLGSQKDIPISEVLIYIENIPFGSDNPISKELKILQRINEEGEKFKRMKINMSIFEMIRNRDSVLYNSISFQIEQSGIRQAPDIQSITKISRTIIKTVSQVREKIYGPFQDNIILFMFLAKLMQTFDMIRHVLSIIQDAINSFSEYSRFDLGWLQSVVFYCYRQKILSHPKYVDSQSYVQEIINLLPQDNFLRQFVKAEIELASIFSVEGKSITFPISGPTGIISMIELEGMIQNLPIATLKELNLERVCELASTMYRIVKREEPPFRLYELYQISINSLLASRELKVAISQMEVLVSLEPDNLGNIVFPIFVFRAISFQLTDQNKQLLSNIIGYLFKQPLQLINVFKSLTAKSFSNDEQKQLLSETLAKSIIGGNSIFSPNNILFDSSIPLYMQQFLQKHSIFASLLNNQFIHMIHSKQEFMKSIDILIYHIIIIQEPSVLINYLHLNKYQLNLKELRAFLSHLSKYETYDPIKVLEFGKRIFKAIYDQNVNRTCIEQVIKKAFATPLSEVSSIDLLLANTDNLQKIVKSIDRFKAKMKAKLFASKKKASLGQQLDVKSVKFSRIDKNLQDIGSLSIAAEYPFNDSDDDVERREYLIFKPFRQEECQSFDLKKYITWLFSRTNQTIEYYLVRENENEADEEMKKQEEALKLSFRKDLKENIKAIQSPQKQKIINEDKLLNSPISLIPMVASSEISVNPTWAEEIDQMYMGATFLKDQVIASITFSEDHLMFDAKLLKAFEPQQLECLLPELLKQIYKDDKIQFNTSLELIRQIYRAYSKIVFINEEFLDIYSKIQQLQKKMTLCLDSRTLLPFQGLLINEKDNALLFAKLKECLCPYLNETNIHTLSKIISMAFKHSEFQHELSNEFLKMTIRQFNEMENPFDSNMKLQTITAFSAKMSMSQLKNIDLEKIIAEISNEEKRAKIVKIMVDTLRQKNEGKTAEHLEQKFTSPIGTVEQV